MHLPCEPDGPGAPCVAVSLSSGAQPQPFSHMQLCGSVMLEHLSQVRAASVVASSRRVDELASALPEVELDEAAQLKRIAALQEENDRLERELKEELEKAGKTLARATAAFEAATNHVFVKADAPEAKAAAAEEMDVEP